MLLFASILLVGLLFWPFILQNIITPLALVAWLFLRLFVLSIDQHFYWGAIIFIALIFLYFLLLQDPTPHPADDFPDTNETSENIRYWRSLFTLTGLNAHDENRLRQELIRLVASLYASKQRTTPNFIFYEALQRGEISLPEHIHAFLFPEKPKTRDFSPKELLQFIREAPRKRWRRWKGLETAEYYRMIAEIISFMETSLEMENDPTKFTPNEH